MLPRRMDLHRIGGATAAARERRGAPTAPVSPAAPPTGRPFARRKDDRQRPGIEPSPDASPLRPIRLLAQEAGPGIAPTAYDTAWLAGLPAERNRRVSRFPLALQWLADHQLPDGSWGGTVRYEHDRVICTLAALTALATLGRRDVDRARVAAGTRYLWQHGHLLGTEPTALVGFELLLPTLIDRATQAGVVVPPHLDLYARERAQVLHLVRDAALYSSQATLAHALEFLGAAADPDRLRQAQGSNGAIGNSPATTAFFVELANNAKALSYLRRSLEGSGGEAAPVLYPCETFELLSTAYHLFLAGVPASRLLASSDQDVLLRAVQAGGVALSPTFPIPDADDTAVALLLLQDLGKPVDSGVLQRFAASDGHFAKFPSEPDASVSASLHVLHALLRVPGYPERDRTIARLLDVLASRQVGGLYWLDKWHISPYYATCHALCIFAALPQPFAAQAAPMADRARTWLRQTQNGDGSWGFHGRRTLEETAYAALALAAGAPETVPDEDRTRCAAAVRCLDVARDPGELGADHSLPALWVDKCLYTPTLVVRGVVEAALRACDRLLRQRTRRGGSRQAS